MTRWQLINGDSRTELTKLADNSIDSIVTDPPYELGFMGKSWDATGIAYDVNLWRECLRVLKPGGHILAFSGSRTYHRMAVAIEDAGFEIRDQIMWVYGSGFPKSLDVSKAIDKQAGAQREVTGMKVTGKARTDQGWQGGQQEVAVTAPATDAAKRWDGWGTALKPAHEPIVLARKPLIGTVANNVLQHGTGALNIDGCRIPGELEGDPNRFSKTDGGSFNAFTTPPIVRSEGRWPANLIHDGSNEVLELFPDTTGGARPAKANKPSGEHYEGGWGPIASGDRIEFAGGSAARFFYCAKANKRDRNEGLENFQPRIINEITPPGTKGSQSPRAGAGRNAATLNHHPTVKPTELMRYLCRLITPPNGIILDPFTGSGSTGKAAILEHFQFIGIEQQPDYITIAQARIQHTESTLP